MVKVNGSITVVDDFTMASRYASEVEVSGNFDLDTLIEIIKTECSPEEVFTELDLETWAEEHDFTKEEEGID